MVNKECKLIGKHGLLNTENLNIGINFMYLKCIINNQIHVSFMHYPLIMAPSREKLMKHIDLFKKAEKVGVKLIYSDDNIKSKDRNVVVFKNVKYQNSAILYSYLVRMYKGLDPFHEINYILNKLMGYDEEYNKNYYLRKYINFMIPAKLKHKVEKINNNIELSQKKKYIKKYKLIKSYDNFRDFDKKFEDVKIKAKKMFEEIVRSQKFINYAKNIKIHKFKFIFKNSVGDNPLYKQK